MYTGSDAIDFVAHHDIQAQAAQSIFEELSAKFDCRWLIGPDRKPSGAASALLIDHAPFQPKIRRSLSAYRNLFHILHDLADFPVYEAERTRLKTCDLLLVPSSMHAEHARRALGESAPIHEIGWPKYDRMSIPVQYAAFAGRLNALPHDITVLYTPTRAFTYEWRYLLPLLRELPCNTILKNHIYVNPGQPMPAGCEEEYEVSMRSANEMESALESYGCRHMVIAPRTLNVCALFPHAQMAIADQSSVLAEFLPFGASVETGRYDPDESHCEPEISRYFDDVVYLPRTELLSVFSSPDNFSAFLRSNARAAIPVPADAGHRAAKLIESALAERESLGACVVRTFQRGREELSHFAERTF